MALQYLSIIGWNSLLLIFFGKSFAEFLNALGVGGAGLDNWLVPVATVVACGVVFFILLRGATGLERISMVLFFFIVGVGLFLITMLLVREGGALATHNRHTPRASAWTSSTALKSAWSACCRGGPTSAR